MNENVIITRSRNVGDYIKHLWDVINLISEDLSEISSIVGVPYSVEEIYESYSRCADGPTILEHMLIEDGKMNEEDCTRNYTMERVIKRIRCVSEEELS